jgi:large subunit ribosomal protein L5
MNVMKKIRIDKVTLNCGTGSDPNKLNKALKLLEFITKRKAVRTYSKKRIPGFGIRVGLPIGCKVTLRGKEAVDVLKRILEGINFTIKQRQFNQGSFSFGIKEYIQVPSITYQREIGIIGFEVTVTLKRAGYNLKKRKIKRANIPKRHYITKEETIEFAKNELNIKVVVK